MLLLFPDSCFDQAGRSLEEKPRRNKIYVPNLDRWTPLQNWHQPQVHIFSWETCDMFISFRTTETETMSILSPLPLEKPCQKQIISRTKFPHWNPFVWPAHQGQTLKLIPKKGYQILETNISPCPIFALEAWRENLKITSVSANLDRWISLKKLALKVCKNCFLGKLVVACLSTLSPLRTFQSGQLIWGMQKKSMAKIQEVHGFIRFTDKTCMS